MHAPKALAGPLAAFVAVLNLGLAAAASGGPACPTTGQAREFVVVEAGQAGTLIAADGTEIVLASLALPHPPEGANQPDLTTTVAGIAGGPVRAVSAGPPDRYGRIRAEVVLSDGRWLQAVMVEAGLAVVRPEGSADPACTKALLALEAAARKAGAGLWADSKNGVKTADDPSLLARNGIYEVVEGRVVSVGYGSRMVFLDFGHDVRTDFTVMVPNPLVPRLLEAGIAVETLAGRKVRVRGVIEESGGPAIRIADPFALEFLDRAE